MLEALISSKTRIKLLLKFFLNPESRAYLRSLETEFGGSTNAIRVELNRFENAGMLVSENQGNRKVFKVKKSHPLFLEVRGIILKHTGLDKIVEHMISRLGDVDYVYLTGDLARGTHSEVIDLIIVGNPDRTYLLDLLEKVEKIVKKKVRYLIYSLEEAEAKEFDPKEYLLLWNEG